ncbi:MAG: hypothetical protein VB058_03605 [Oscillospiraceae bacterium]|nr:hypothetical protein [Oscillospiraceae bacterium]
MTLDCDEFREAGAVEGHSFFVGFSPWGGAIFFDGRPPRRGKGAGKQTGETVCRLPFRLFAVQENGEMKKSLCVDLQDCFTAPT